jgi:DNA-binding transcriptional MerR regulator
MPQTGDDLLAPSIAAALIGVSRDTLKRYEDRDGLISSVRTPSGHRRYRRSEVEALITKAKTA